MANDLDDINLTGDDDNLTDDTTVDTSTATGADATTTKTVDQFSKVFGDVDGTQDKTKDGTSKASSVATTGADGKGATAKQAGAGSKGNFNGTQPTAGLKPVMGMKGAWIHPTGNIVNARGEVIAAAGKEHGAYLRDLKGVEDVQNYRKLRDEHANLTKELEVYKGANVIAQKAGLSAQEIMYGMNLAAAWKNDRKKTLNHLLTTAREAGDNLDDLGVAGGGSIDADAIYNRIAALVEDKLKPFSFVVDDRTSQMEQRRMQTEVEAEINEFYANFPDARPHENTIADIMRAAMDRGQMITKEQAYAMTVRYAAEHGLDYSKPLHEQLQQGNQDDDDDGQRKPAPRRGTAPLRTGGGAARPMNTKIANASDSWDSILREVITEHRGN